VGGADGDIFLTVRDHERTVVVVISHAGELSTPASPCSSLPRLISS